MKNGSTKTLFVLIILTIIVGVLSSFEAVNKNLFILILGLSSVKFLLVAFQFMELKKAHVAWKIILVIYLLIFLSIVSLLLMKT